MAEPPPAAPPAFKVKAIGAAKKGAGLAPALGHVHGPGCGHGHPHEAGHDHDHAKCDHDHDHDHTHVEAPPTQRACEQGALAVQLDLEALLPGETDDEGRFAKLADALQRIVGVVRVHLRTDGPHAEVCVHYDREVARPVALIGEVRHRAGAVRQRYVAQTWFVNGMDSAQCGYVIEHVLQRTPGVLSANVAYAAERLVVEFDAERVTAADLARRIGHLGYELHEPEAGHVCAHHAHAGGLAPKLELPFVVVSGVLLALDLVLGALGQRPPWLETALCAAALVFGGAFAGRAALMAVRARHVDIEVLTVLAAFGAAAMGAWFEGAFLLFLFSLGHMLEHRALDKARRAIEALGKLRPESARVERAGAVVDTPVGSVQANEIVLVLPGDRVPLDGVVVEGESHANQAALTGESLPVPKTVGDPVFAGSLNADGALRVRATKTAGESTLAKLVDLVTQAEARKGKAHQVTKRLEQIFVPAVLAATPVLVAALWWTGTPVQDAVLRGLSLLVAASPCALAVATPAVVLSAVARAARSGVLIKGGVHLETLGKLGAVAFDKTGTLTVGQPTVQNVVPIAHLGADEVLAMAASAEMLSAHPLAVAVVEAARARELPLRPAGQAKAIHGKGLYARVDGKDVKLGSAAFFADLPEVATQAVVAEQGQGRTTMVVAVDDVVVGVLSLADTPRREAITALSRLKAIGLHRTVMLSGDAAMVAQAVARQLGLAEAKAPLLPDGKVAHLRQMMRDEPGKVAMVGDGVNDAPALATAHIGVAMGGAGSDVALETADVVLMGDDLRKLPFAVQLGRAAQTAVRANIAVALGVAAVLIVAAVAGWVQVSQAVLLHEGSTVFVVVNGLRLLWFREK
ncbi:MAG: cadmium-translocating P-type ATPase [Deltaproteobacteria bacterium]|nr:cadmium-translocating P-type ATPase [Deltaproteobacteria bacterium]